MSSAESGVSPAPKPCCAHALWDFSEESAESNQKEASWGARPSGQTLTPRAGRQCSGKRRRPRLDAPPSPAPRGLWLVPQPRLAGRSGPPGPAATGALRQGQRGQLGPEQESAVPAGGARPPHTRPRPPSSTGECPRLSVLWSSPRRCWCLVAALQTRVAHVTEPSAHVTEPRATREPGRGSSDTCLGPRGTVWPRGTHERCPSQECC